jgi:polygalacturonase
MNKRFFFLLFTSFICFNITNAAIHFEDNDSTLSIVAGDTTLQTTYIQNAINYCNSTGGGTVRLTLGTYRTAPVTMKSNVTLRIDSGATLLGSPNMADWTEKGSLKNLINNSNAISNVTITGQGTIDGSGAPWWTAYEANTSLTRPRLIQMQNVTNLTIDSVTLQNPPMFHIAPENCKNVLIDHVIINTIDTSPNTDGIDPAECYNVVISNCYISDGDDNIAIKSAAAYGFGGCQDITVANCTFGAGHGLSIGSGTSSGYNNLRVTGCTFNGTTNGIRIKSGPGEGGLVSNVYYSNITMKNVYNPIVVDFAYQNVVTTPPDIPALGNFYINNLTVTGSNNAGQIIGLTNSILQNINFSNVNIAAKNGMTLSYANDVTFKNVTINKAPAKNGTNVKTTGVTNTTGF